MSVVDQTFNLKCIYSVCDVTFRTVAPRPRPLGSQVNSMHGLMMARHCDTRL